MKPGLLTVRLLLASVAVLLAASAFAPATLLAAAGCPGTIKFDNGAGTGVWQTPQNWDTDVLPGPADDVCIPAGMNVTLPSGTHTINSVFVESGATLALS